MSKIITTDELFSILNRDKLQIVMNWFEAGNDSFSFKYRNQFYIYYNGVVPKTVIDANYIRFGLDSNNHKKTLIKTYKEIETKEYNRTNTLML